MVLGKTLYQAKNALTSAGFTVEVVTLANPDGDAGVSGCRDPGENTSGRVWLADVLRRGATPQRFRRADLREPVTHPEPAGLSSASKPDHSFLFFWSKRSIFAR